MVLQAGCVRLASTRERAGRQRHGAGATRIVGCAFELNAAKHGGAAYAYDRVGPTTIADCVFRLNRASSVRIRLSFSCNVTAAFTRPRAERRRRDQRGR